MPSILVFCDLDDTLFDPHAFCIDASTRRALDCIEREHFPIVLCSRRTRAELEMLQQELGIRQPFICEDGGAVLLPPGYFGSKLSAVTSVSGYEIVEFGRPREELTTVLHRSADALGVRVLGFSDMPVEEVANEFDLTLLQARLAKMRDYSEPFRVLAAKPGALARLVKVLRAVGLDCASRGRHYHLAANHRGDCAHYLLGRYRRVLGDTVTVAFCDHTSAAPLLYQADIPLVVKTDTSEEAARLLAGMPAARLSAVDSVGAWAEAILEIADASARHARHSSIWRACYGWPLRGFHNAS